MVVREQLSFPWLGERVRRTRTRRVRVASKSGTQPRLPWRVTLPRVRGDCLSGSARRALGEEMCRHLTCRHNLLGELTRRPAGEAEAAMMALLSGEWNDTCALDVADRGGIEDSAIALILGSTPKRVTQISAEALYRARSKIAADSVLSVEFADELAERKRNN
jgi:hypothetical protein